MLGNFRRTSTLRKIAKQGFKSMKNEDRQIHLHTFTSATTQHMYIFTDTIKHKYIEAFKIYKHQMPISMSTLGISNGDD